MVKDEDDIKLEVVNVVADEAAGVESVREEAVPVEAVGKGEALQNIAEDDEAPKEESIKEELKAKEQKALTTLKRIRENVREEDAAPAGSQTLRMILGGDVLSAQLVRRNIWLFVLMVFFTVLYVAFRYQCQQDMIAIDRLEKELKDAKYRALSSSSTLTERCRESQVLEVLRENKDSVLHISDQPPFIINVPEGGLFNREDR